MGLPATANLMMCSREIAQLTGKEHKNVLRDIRVQLLMVLCDKEVRQMHATHGRTMALSAFVATNNVEMFKSLLMGHGSNLSHEQNQGFSVELDERGYIAAIYLNRTHTLTLMTGYDVVARAKVVARWEELEDAFSRKQTHDKRVPQTYSEALRLAADQADLIERQQAQLQAAAPALQFVERYVEPAPGEMTFRQVAKLLRANEAALRQFLFDRRVVYALRGRMTPYQEHISSGRMVMRTGFTTGANAKPAVSANFTGKGVLWIAGLWAQHQAAKQLQLGLTQ